MKKTNYLLAALIVMLTIFAACKKDEGVNADYAASYKAWKAFKLAVNDSYEYAVVTGSWTGYTTETIITVKNGKVVQRAHSSATTDRQTGAKTIVEQWVEHITTLNVHKNAAALTLDEVYLKAKHDWLVKSNTRDTYFENTNQGMISTAGYTTKDCMDDCFNGIKINFVRKITNEI